MNNPCLKLNSNNCKAHATSTPHWLKPSVRITETCAGAMLLTKMCKENNVSHHSKTTSILTSLKGVGYKVK